MSTNNDIKILLNIQDENISFEDNCVTEGTYKGNKCHFIEGKLTHHPTHCKVCGTENEDYMIYKNGTQVSRITIPAESIYPFYLILKKQRFFCKACQSSFTAETNFVRKHCFISNYTKTKVVVKSAEAQSIKDISKDCRVSSHTVQREINKASQSFKPARKQLPKHLSFDEFKYAKGNMAFEYINVETGDILDILEQRTKRMITEHFISNYSLKERKKVESVTIDMNAGYVSVIKEMFPKANIIIDQFHLVQLINRSMNKIRVHVMNTLKTSNNEDMKKYRRLKRYWKLILKSESNLSYTEYKYYRLFGQRLEAEIVQEMIQFDETLYVNYKLYQTLLKAIQNKNYKLLEHTLQTTQHKLTSNYMKTSMKTLKAHLPFIQNSFIYPFNNGRIEGINNKIKVLNRVAYGYRNFSHYKKRIMIHFKFKAQVTKPEHRKTHVKAS